MTAVQPLTERRLLCVVAPAVFTGPFNSTVIVLALPAIARDFALTAGSTTWLVTVYLIASGALLPVAGKLGDLFGHRTVLLGGLAVSVAGALGAALANELPVLMACRVAQAIGGAMLRPAGTALLCELVPRQRLGRRLGLVGSAATLATAAGPALGGLLLAAGGWRMIFWINLPLLLLPLAMGWRALPRSRRLRGRAPFDLLGACLLVGLLIALAQLLALPSSWSAVAGWTAACALLAMIFIRHEQRHPDPLVRLQLLHQPQFMASTVGMALGNFALYGLLLTVPVLLAGYPDWPQSRTGFVLAALTVALTAAAPLGGGLADRFGQWSVAAAGLIMIAVAIVPLAADPSGFASVMLVLPLAVVGMGLGLSTPALQLGAVQAAPDEETGAAVGLFGASRYLGSIASSSLLAGPLAPLESSFGVFSADFFIFAAATAFGAIVIWALRYREPIARPAS
jgi:MFS family permease